MHLDRLFVSMCDFEFGIDLVEEITIKIAFVVVVVTFIKVKLEYVEAEEN